MVSMRSVIAGVVVLAALALLAYVYMGSLKPTVAGNVSPPTSPKPTVAGCGSLPAPERNACCERMNRGKPVPQCAGNWKYDNKKGICAYECAQAEEMEETREKAKSECNKENVAAVYVCGKNIQAVSSLLGGGSRYIRADGSAVNCPIVAPAYMTPECKAMSKGKCELICENKPEPRSCPEDARICPDGTVLTRTGPNCEFPECPKAQESVNRTSETAGDVVEANNRFALDLYRQLKAGEGNIFYSPWSISVALAMTYEGARGNTRAEMRNVLYLPEGDEARRTAYKDVLAQINKPGKKYELYTANALWPHKDYKFLDSYLNVIKEYYGGEATPLDYVMKTEEARQTINGWVEDQTKDKIKDLIGPGVLNPLTRLVLTNAIYFKGKWVMEFDKKDTVPMDFRTGPGKTVKADMMSLLSEDARFRYAEADGLQLLELPYDGKEVSMLILLPRKDGIEPLEDKLTVENLNEWKGRMTEQRVDVYIPKYKLETEYSLPKELMNLGMKEAFTRDADFSGMDGTKYLYIKDVIHKAYVDVNEEGTEAAAATAVIIALKSAMPERIPEFKADHPFMFVIEDTATGNILFIGKVADPGSA